jgi:hypothetical protein
VLFPVVALFIVWIAANNRFAAFASLATTPGNELPGSPDVEQVAQGVWSGAVTPALGNAVTKATGKATP